MTSAEDDLFGRAEQSVTSSLREVERFGKWDAKTGLALRNYYSNQLAGAALAAYEKGFREERRTR